MGLVGGDQGEFEVMRMLAEQAVLLVFTGTIWNLSEGKDPALLEKEAWPKLAGRPFEQPEASSSWPVRIQLRQVPALWIWVVGPSDVSLRV